MRVLLVDDHNVFRESLRIALADQACIDVIGEASTGRDALALASQQAADLLVVDLMLGDGDAMALTRELRRQRVMTRVLVLSMHDSRAFVHQAFQAGAQGYALKAQPLAEVIEGMRVVESGGRYLAPSLADLPAMPQKDRDLLSGREREIFTLIVQGHSSVDIAASLSISLKTVETHRSHINKKLGVRSPAELIRLAALQGLLATSPWRPRPH
jgi:DNA-binding NarL/FixJ family response regulator